AIFRLISPPVAIAVAADTASVRHRPSLPALRVVGREHLADDLLDVKRLVAVAVLALVLRRRRRDERRARHLQDAVPVDAAEERVGPDAARADALLGVLLEEAGDEVAQRRLLADELRLLGEDAVEGLLAALPPERRAAVEHLVEHHAQAPPVHREVVAAPGDDLRRHVVLRPHERVRLRGSPPAGGCRGGGRGRRRGRRRRGGGGRARGGQRRPRVRGRGGRLCGDGGAEWEAQCGARWLPCTAAARRRRGDRKRRLGIGTGHRRVRLLRRRREPRGEVEIDEHDVAAVLDEDVLRLEVPVHDAEAVQVLERQHQLRGEEPAVGKPKKKNRSGQKLAAKIVRQLLARSRSLGGR
uniref:Uncharacterized protein n=1 Tax=Zea mays TaxID=4577 RepID=A0A804RJ50_MAIZE